MPSPVRFTATVEGTDKVREGQRGFRARELALRAAQCGVQGRGVYAKQQLPGLDVGAFLEMPAQHDTRDTRAHLGHARGRDAARIFLGHFQRARLDRDGLHLCGRRRRGVRRLATASTDQNDCSQARCERTYSTLAHHENL